jgi:polar amino acid transport system permease protein
VNLSVVTDSWTVLLQGLGVTLLLSALTIIGGTALGLLVGLTRTSGPAPLRVVARIYIEIFRGTPLLIQLLFVYFGAFSLGFEWNSTLAAATTSLVLYEGAYIAEIFRAGIEAVPLAQREAATVLGLRKRTIFARVVLPQAMQISRAPLVGQYIGLVKDTSLATVVGLAELMREGQAIVDRTAQPLTVYLAVAVLYFLICYPMSLFVRHMERRAPVRA